MKTLKEHIKYLFSDCTDLDVDLKEIISINLKKKYSFDEEIRNLRFAETASHVMFFNSKKENSLSNAPLNSKILSGLNNSNVSLSLSASKIKLNNPSSPLYLDFFGNLIRILPNDKYKNSFVYCLDKLDQKHINNYKKSMALYYKQLLVKNISGLKESPLLKNAGCMDNEDFLDKHILKNKDNLRTIEDQKDFEKSIYEDMIFDMEASFVNQNHIGLTDQVNYVQSNLVNNAFHGNINHYYLELEKIGSELFLSKIKDRHGFLYKIFFDKEFFQETVDFFDEPFFLIKNGISLDTLDNQEIENYFFDKFVLELKDGNILLNTKFSLFILSFYGLQAFGGRFQKLYMKDFIESFKKFLNIILQNDEIILRDMKSRIEKIKLFDIASTIIAKREDRLFCNYATLLLGKYSIEDNWPFLCSQTMDCIQENTDDYLKTKNKK
jgi:hypothetical protein